MIDWCDNSDKVNFPLIGTDNWSYLKRRGCFGIFTIFMVRTWLSHTPKNHFQFCRLLFFFFTFWYIKLSFTTNLKMNSFQRDLNSIYMKDLADWPLMTTKNIKFMTKQDHLLRNSITGMSSSEQPFFDKIYCNVCSNGSNMIKHKVFENINGEFYLSDPRCNHF